MQHYLEFEKHVTELESKIAVLKHASKADGVDIADVIDSLTAKVNQQLRAVYSNLTAWQITQVARHPSRPKAKDYIDALITEFTSFAGDRAFGDDAAVIGGLGRFCGQSVVVLGTEKGSDTETRIKHNFGMARPEGYRKAQRLMKLAGRFKLPIITFVDTSGAYPGIAAEARGQAEAIARSIDACLEAPVPIVATIIGEGGSGGAIALATGDSVMMLEHSIYSVIPPEGCAAILWRSSAAASQAAEALKLTAYDLRKLGLIDVVIPEPLGGAHREPIAAIATVANAIEAALRPLLVIDSGILRARRREKYLAMGRNELDPF